MDKSLKIENSTLPVKITGRGQYDFRGLDLSRVNENWNEILSSENLNDIIFDSNTVFPMEVKDKFDERLNIAKNPGLGINELHEKGLTGKGINVAIIDTPLLTSHNSVKNNLIHYENTKEMDDVNADMHGTAVVSILTNVLPDAGIVYFAHPDKADRNDLVEYNIDALRKIIELNSKLKDEEKIHIVSCSWSIETDNPKDKERYKDIIKECEDNDIFVLTTSSYETHNFYFIGSDRDISKNLDNPENYSAPIFLKDKINNKQMPKHIMVPQDRITTASPTGDNDYVYYNNGGMSWAVPHMAGIYALAKSVLPSLDPKQFYNTAIKTGTSKDINGTMCSVINPVNLIKDLEFYKATNKIQNKLNNNINIGNVNDR